MTQCVALARASRMRLTRLDACGAPVPGATGTLVSDGMINVDYTPNYLDPEEITQLNANGDLCIDDQGRPQLRWLDLSIVMCRVDPDAVNIITGNPLVANDATPTPESVGFRIDGALTGTANFALELWSNVANQACNAGGDKLYGYWLLPFVVQARIGQWSVANAALNLTFTARTSVDPGWGTGPSGYLVRSDAMTGTPEVLLTAVGANTHSHFEIVDVAPPAAACGASVLAA